MKATAAFLALALAARAAAAPSAGPAARLDALAERFVAELVAYDPTIAYTTGVPTDDHARLADISPAAIAAHEARQRAELAALRAIDPAILPAFSHPGYAMLKDQLEGGLGVRVCRQELWDVNHIVGWQNQFDTVAQSQPVGTPAARQAALVRWSSFPAYLDQDMANLRSGLAQGYSAPKSVVRRVIQQTAALASDPVERSPFYAPAARDGDPAFKTTFAAVIRDKVQPAIRRYHDFLVADYLPRARESVAVGDLPNGPACYRALLRQFTTLDRAPEAVFALGEKTVAANKAKVVELGRSLYGLHDFAAIVARAKQGSGNRFSSADDLLAFSRDTLAEAKAKSATLVDRMPRQDAIILPEEPSADAAGSPSHYDPNPDPAKPGVYRIELKNWADQPRGLAAVVVVHETWPGHHLQMALSRELQADTPLANVAINSAYLEGWARYAEAMAEEAGMYHLPSSLILRRAWPARGMVVDPGLHLFHWTRARAIAFLLESGQFTPQSADDMVDRIAAWPGQLTAYDSGALEFFALRAEARTALGKRFDIREFNRVAVEEGVVPLPELRDHVEAWLRTKRASILPP